MQRVRLPLLAARFLLVASAAAAPQSAEIRGARISLAPKAIDVENLAIENRHGSPLVAWELRWLPTSPCPAAADDRWRGGAAAAAAPAPPMTRYKCQGGET